MRARLLSHVPVRGRWKKSAWRKSCIGWQILPAFAALIGFNTRVYAIVSWASAPRPVGTLLGLEAASYRPVARLFKQLVSSAGQTKDEWNYHIPPLFGQPEQALEEKLDEYIETVNSYTDSDIARMPTKWRTLLLGIKSGLELPSLLQAVRHLYVDILPLRIGGDFIMKEINESISETRGSKPVTDADLILASNLFVELDVDGSGTVSEDNLRALGLSRSAATDVMDAIDTDGNKEIDLFEFLSESDGELDIFDVLGRNLASTAHAAQDFTAGDIKLIVSKMRLDSAMRTEAASAIGSQYETRFNDILQFIIALEEKLANRTVSSNLVRTVLSGSFEAARNPRVVAALRFVYSEIGPIRVAGDMVFSVVTQYLDF